MFHTKENTVYMITVMVNGWNIAQPYRHTRSFLACTFEATSCIKRFTNLPLFYIRQHVEPTHVKHFLEVLKTHGLTGNVCDVRPWFVFMLTWKVTQKYLDISFVWMLKMLHQQSYIIHFKCVCFSSRQPHIVLCEY